MELHKASPGRTFLFSGTFEVRVIYSDAPATPPQDILPSYTALKPCALTAKSVVNHKASIDPLLTIGDGSMNPDNLEGKRHKRGFPFCLSVRSFGLLLKLNVSGTAQLLYSFIISVTLKFSGR